MSLTLSAESLGIASSVSGSFSSNTFTVSTSVLNGNVVDLVEEGFREGDKIKITKNSGNFSTGNSSETFVISAFGDANKTITLLTTGNDSDDSSVPTDTSVAVTIELDSEELKSASLERGTNAANPSFLNREVFIHKIFINPETGAVIGNTSVLVFKGIISSCNIQESINKTQVKWNLHKSLGRFYTCSRKINDR